MTRLAAALFLVAFLIALSAMKPPAKRRPPPDIDPSPCLPWQEACGERVVTSLRSVKQSDHRPADTEAMALSPDRGTRPMSASAPSEQAGMTRIIFPDGDA